MQLQPHSRLLFIGDSITDCGRRRPVGQGAFDQALGDGYVSLVNAALAAGYPEHPIHIINMGVAGNTVRDLEVRWRSDVLDLQPDWLSIKIGINDVWRLFGGFMQRRQHVAKEAYAQTLDKLVQQVRPRLQGLILMTPYYLETNRQEPMRAMMDEYGAVVRQLAEKYEAVLVDTQAAFDRLLQYASPQDLAMDGVHVNLTGHMVLARAFLQAIDYRWERLTGSGSEED